MELDHSSSPLIELALSSCIPFHPHDKRQKCWTRDAELSQVKASGPTCHTSKLIKRCHVAIIWFASSLPSESSSCARLLRQSFANEHFALENDSAKTSLYRIYGHVAAESAQKLIPFGKGIKNFQEIVSEISGNTQRAWPYESFSSVHVTTIGVDRGCTLPS